MNQAGDDIWVIVHLYDKGVMLSNILNNHFVQLANKYKHVKFVRGVAKVCFIKFHKFSDHKRFIVSGLCYQNYLKEHRI